MATLKYNTVKIEKLLNIFTIFLTAVLILSISLETFVGDSFFVSRETYSSIQFWICIYFLFDFLFLLFLAKNKKSFFKNYSIFILFSIPYNDLLNFFSIQTPQEIAYALKFVPVMRGGAALFLLTHLIVKNKITGLFISYIIIFLSIFYFQTLIFYIFEKGINHAVKDYYDVLWWAAMSVTTVGSTIIAQTAPGKIATTILAVVGMTTLPIFTVYITSVIQRISQSDSSSKIYNPKK